MQSTNLVILFVPDQIISRLISPVIFLRFNPPISDSSDNLHNLIDMQEDLKLITNTCIPAVDYINTENGALHYVMQFQLLGLESKNVTNQIKFAYPLVFPLGRNVPRLWLRRIAQGMYHLLTGEEVHVRLVVRKSIDTCVSQLTNKCSINDQSH